MTREEATEILKDLWTYLQTDIRQALEMAIKALEQEPKTGHWIWCVGSHKCSNCEEYTCFSHKELLRYCPNCGAKMVKPDEGYANDWIGYSR